MVTGGAGFIGSHLVKRLVDLGHNVTVVDTLLNGNKLDDDIKKSINLEKIDIRDLSSLRKCIDKIDYIYHFAAVLGVDIVADNPLETMEVESIGMKNIVQIANEKGSKKIIYASTSGVYGKTAIERSVEEDFIVDPRSSYSIAKRYNEIYLASAFQETEIQSISLRFFNVYGIKQDNRMVIPKFFEQAFKGNPITVFGSGEQTRDFTYIDDVIKSTINLADKVEGCEIFNVCGKNEYSILDLAKKIKSIVHSKSKIECIDLPRGRYDFEVERRSGSSEKLMKAIDYRPSTKLSDGLNKIHTSLKSEN